MSKYTAELVNGYIPCLEARDLFAEADMLRAYAALLNERDQAKQGVTNGAVEAAVKAFIAATSDGNESLADLSEDDTHTALTGMRAALEAVWLTTTNPETTSSKLVGEELLDLIVRYGNAREGVFRAVLEDQRAAQRNEAAEIYADIRSMLAAAPQLAAPAERPFIDLQKLSHALSRLGISAPESIERLGAEAENWIDDVLDAVIGGIDAALPRSVAPPALYQHDDGRYALALGDVARHKLTDNDPAWHRVPLDVVVHDSAARGAVNQSLTTERLPEAVWRPIEAAPKNGEIVLLGSIDDTHVMVREGRWDEKVGKWSWPWISGLSPTLWMPVPQPPAEGEESAR